MVLLCLSGRIINRAVVMLLIAAVIYCQQRGLYGALSFRLRGIQVVMRYSWSTLMRGVPIQFLSWRATLAVKGRIRPQFPGLQGVRLSPQTAVPGLFEALQTYVTAHLRFQWQLIARSPYHYPGTCIPGTACKAAFTVLSPWPCYGYGHDFCILSHPNGHS